MTESTSHGVTSGLRGRLLFRGAEADVVRGEWQGLDAVFKVRKRLRYRLPALDAEIRRQRTLREAEMIHRAKEAGVAAPCLYDVDVARTTLVMEYVHGERLMDLVRASGKRETERVFYEFGGDVARLHASGIMHGDLTTANVLRRDRDLVFIDFGLSANTTRLEDHAVDIRLIKETLVGAHPAAAAVAMESISRGYEAVLGAARTRLVLRQLVSIERRGRYARVA